MTEARANLIPGVPVVTNATSYCNLSVIAGYKVRVTFTKFVCAETQYVTAILLLLEKREAV
jgi:hypothetical protein